jgi:diguanylate cyclase
MFEPPSGKDNSEHWREKYLSQGEAYDKQVKELENYSNLLQRALVRISLAADGQDPVLDKALEELRRLLRKASPDTKGISNNLAKIETKLLQLDNDRDQSGNTGMNALNSLVNQLLNMELSRENKNSLKSIASALKKQGNDLKAYPQLLNEYAQIQQRAINDSLQKLKQNSNNASPSQQSRGFLSKLFSSSDSPAEQIEPPVEKHNSPTASPVPAQAQASHQANTQTVANGGEQEAIKSAQEKEHVQTRQPVDRNQQASNESVDFQYVCEGLANLIERLALPESEQITADLLRKKIADNLRQTEAVAVIHELAQLVIKAVDKGQQDFEAFLETLDKRLLEINAFLSENHKTETERRSASGQFDQNMRSQVGSFSEAVMEAKDINLLKTAVQAKLDRITASMDEWAEAEKEHEDQINEQVSALKERLTLMENESGAIKKRLQLESLKALTDILTGVPNREAMDERLKFEWTRFQRYRKPAVLALLDIDHFKSVNDEYGHLVGDKVLKDISKRVQKLIRNTDFFARFGGEEFVIIMPETTVEGAKLALNNIREKIEKMALSYLKKDKNITVSFGFVDFRIGVNIESLFDLADKALYRAKVHGRNRVEAAK